MPRLAWWAAAFAAVAPLAHADDRPVSRIAVGSCADQHKACPVWDRIAAQDPDLFLLLGDAVYADLEDGKLTPPAKPEHIAECFEQLKKVPGFQALRAKCPLLAVWDDHDYGVNDGGADYEFKDRSEQLFLDFLGVPADSPRRQRKGIYHAETFGPPGKRVQVILLDGRYHRSKLEKGPRAKIPGYSGTIAPYLPNTAADATLLGAEQWAWLEEQLRQPADLRLLCSGIQVVPDEHPFEKWTNVPAERERLYKLIRDTGATGVVVLSGDRHLGELSLDPPAVGYPLYDLTTSGLNQGSDKWRAPEPNRHRVAAMPTGNNFGLVTIDWAAADPAVSLQLRDETGEVVVRHSFPLKLLRPDGKDKPAGGGKPEDKPKLPDGVIGPEEARKKVGEEVTVQMEVKGGKAFKDRILLNSEKDFKSEKNFTVVVNSKALTGKLDKADYDTFKGKTVRVKGKVTEYKGAAELQVDDEKQLEFVEEKKDK